MAAVAREHIAAEGWRNVTVVQSPAEDAEIAVTADAALFCAVHDILQSPGALRNVMKKLRPGAPVAAGGGKWAAPWMVGVNLQVRMLHAPYVRSFGGFGRPWSHLEQLIEDVDVRELAFGSGYIVTGQAPPQPFPSRAAASSGCSSARPATSGWRAQHAAAARLYRAACLEQRTGEQQHHDVNQQAGAEAVIFPARSASRLRPDADDYLPSPTRLCGKSDT